MLRHLLLAVAAVAALTVGIGPMPALAFSHATTNVAVATQRALAPESTAATVAVHVPWSCRRGDRTICINKRTRWLTYMRYGAPVRGYAVRLGRQSQPTHNGTFFVYWKHRWHWSSAYGSSMPFSLFFSGGQAIHYSANFAQVGYAGASHGCVNLRSWSGARWLYDHTPLGTRVYVGYW